MKIRIVLALAIVTSSMVRAEERVCAVHIESPNYPDVARQAQIEGVVRVKLSVDESGVGRSATAEGPVLLSEEAKRNALTWTFARGSAREIEIVYYFRLAKPKLAYRPVPDIRFDLPGRVTITSHAPLPIRDDEMIKPNK